MVPSPDSLTAKLTALQQRWADPDESWRWTLADCAAELAPLIAAAQALESPRRRTDPVLVRIRREALRYSAVGDAACAEFVEQLARGQFP